MKQYMWNFFSHVIMWCFLYCTYYCNPPPQRSPIFYCKYTNHSQAQCPLNLTEGGAGLQGVSSANTLHEVKQWRLYKARFLLLVAHKRDFSQRGGALTMRTSIALLVLLAVASHTVASKYRKTHF